MYLSVGSRLRSRVWESADDAGSSNSLTVMDRSWMQGTINPSTSLYTDPQGCVMELEPVSQSISQRASWCNPPHPPRWRLRFKGEQRHNPPLSSSTLFLPSLPPLSSSILFLPAFSPYSSSPFFLPTLPPLSSFLLFLPLLPSLSVQSSPNHSSVTSTPGIWWLSS